MWHNVALPFILKNILTQKKNYENSNQLANWWFEPDAPLLVLESFPKTPRNHLKHPGSVDLITTKQNKNKLLSFIGRLSFNTYLAHVNWVTLIGTSPKEILRLWQPRLKNKSYMVLHGLLHDHVKRGKF